MINSNVIQTFLIISEFESKKTKLELNLMLIVITIVEKQISGLKAHLNRAALNTVRNAAMLPDCFSSIRTTTAMA